MTSLLSLVAIKPKALAVAPQVPLHLRVRAAAEIRAAVQAGRVTSSDLAAAMAGGDAGIADLMCRHHVLRANVAMPSAGMALKWTPEKDTITRLLAWAGSLRKAGKLQDDVLTSLRPDTAFLGLLGACTKAVQSASREAHTAATELPFAYEAAPLFHVGTSFSEGFSEFADIGVEAPVVIVEPMYLPVFDMPSCPDAADATALRSALAAIGRADMFGMWIEPRHLPWAVDGWLVESLEDIGIKSSLNKPPVVTSEDLEMLEEMFGFGFEGEEGADVIAQHISYLRGLQAAVVWKPGSAAMKKWMKANAGTPLEALVRKLLGVAKRMDAIKLTNADFEMDMEGDPTAIMLMERADISASYFFNNMSEYGSSESPSKRIIPTGESAQNPSLFWQLHDSVVLVVSLLTDAANAIQSYKPESPRELGIAA